MGFFDFLRGKPKAPEEPVLEEVSLSNLVSWMEGLHSSALSETKEKLREIQEKVSQEKENLKEKISTLQEAEIKNQKIPDRAKQAMEGNRETYIQKLSAFLEKVDFPIDPEKTREFHDYFDKKLNEFEKTVARNHAVVEQFFGEKAGAILVSMKNLDKLVKESDSFVKSSELKKVNLLQDQVKNFNKSLKRKHSLKKEIDFSMQDLKKSTEKIQSQEAELQTLEKNKDYLDTLELQKKQDVLEKNLTSHNAVLQHSFSEISSALKKYENLSQNKTAKAYLENPLAALRQDVDFEITGILSATLTAIKSAEITLKDKKKDKTLGELEKLNEEYFKSFKQKQKDLNNQITQIKETLSASEITKQITQIKEEISHNKIKLKDKKLDLHEKQKDFDKIDPAQLKTDLEDKINSVLENKQIKFI
jgi:hypothetical protein